MDVLGDHANALIQSKGMCQKLELPGWKASSFSFPGVSLVNKLSPFNSFLCWWIWFLQPL